MTLETAALRAAVLVRAIFSRAMLLLVDYDNLRKPDQSRGLEHIVSKVANLLGPAEFKSTGRARVRLYGGWYERSSYTRVAQDLAAEIQRISPLPLTVSDGTKTIRTVATIELATSLEAEPTVDFVHTYRPRGSPSGILPAAVPFTGCANAASCGLTPVHTFLTAGSCPIATCSVDVGDVVQRAEQKLVDTMVTADAILSVTRGIAPIVVVSSDDDMWAGIRTVLGLGGRVLHVHPKPIRPTITYYQPPASPSYASFQM